MRGQYHPISLSACLRKRTVVDLRQNGMTSALLFGIAFGMVIAQQAMLMLAFQGRLLNRAAEISGGWRALSTRLGVGEHSLRLWMDGKARLPEQVFLKAADMVLEDDIARASQDRRNQPRVAPLRETETATPNGRQA